MTSFCQFRVSQYTQNIHITNISGAYHHFFPDFFTGKVGFSGQHSYYYVYTIESEFCWLIFTFYVVLVFHTYRSPINGLIAPISI